MRAAAEATVSPLQPSVAIPTSPDDRRSTVYYLGGVIFALLAIVLVVAFMNKFRQSHD